MILLLVLLVSNLYVFNVYFRIKKKLPCSQLDLRTSQMTAFKTGGPRSPVEDVKIVSSISTFVINT